MKRITLRHWTVQDNFTFYSCCLSVYNCIFLSNSLSVCWLSAVLSLSVCLCLSSSSALLYFLFSLFLLLFFSASHPNCTHLYSRSGCGYIMLQCCPLDRHSLSVRIQHICGGGPVTTQFTVLEYYCLAVFINGIMTGIDRVLVKREKPKKNFFFRKL